MVAAVLAVRVVVVVGVAAVVQVCFVIIGVVIVKVVNCPSVGVPFVSVEGSQQFIHLQAIFINYVTPMKILCNRLTLIKCLPYTIKSKFYQN